MSRLHHLPRELLISYLNPEELKNTSIAADIILTPQELNDVSLKYNLPYSDTIEDLAYLFSLNDQKLLQYCVMTRDYEAFKRIGLDNLEPSVVTIEFIIKNKSPKIAHDISVSLLSNDRTIEALNISLANEDLELITTIVNTKHELYRSIDKITRVTNREFSKVLLSNPETEYIGASTVSRNNIDLLLEYDYMRLIINPDVTRDLYYYFRRYDRDIEAVSLIPNFLDVEEDDIQYLHAVIDKYGYDYVRDNVYNAEDFENLLD